MADLMKAKAFDDAESRVHRIRITLTSTNVKSLERGVWWFLGKIRYVRALASAPAHTCVCKSREGGVR